jgi:hypothetical protein
MRRMREREVSKKGRLRCDARRDEAKENEDSAVVQEGDMWGCSERWKD